MWQPYHTFINQVLKEVLPKVLISHVNIFFIVLQAVPVNDGIELLQMVLNFNTKDPLILSCVLTNVSALFPFVTYRPEFLPQVFSKVNSISFVNFEYFWTNYFFVIVFESLWDKLMNSHLFIHQVFSTYCGLGTMLVEKPSLTFGNKITYTVVPMWHYN